MAHAGTILFADEKRACRDKICMLARQEGYECQCTQDAEDAIGLLQQNRFDVLVANVRLGNGTDLQVVREARKLDDTMAILVVADHPSADTAIQSVEISAMAYLIKPLHWDLMRGRVRVAIQKSQRRRSLSMVHQRLQTALADVNDLRPHLYAADTVSSATIRAMASSLSELLDLASGPNNDLNKAHLCELLDCSKKNILAGG